MSTRPVGDELIAEAAKNNIVIDESSFIKIEEIKDTSIAEKIKELSHQNISVVFTSANAAEAVGKLVSIKTSWKIFCISNATKKIVTKIFGEKNISETADSAEQLAGKIIENPLIKNIVFFCGDQRRDELPLNLKKNHVNVEEIIVYKTIQTPYLLARQYEGILFFSPSAVQSFFSKNSIEAKTQLFAIGATTAGAIASFTCQPVIVAEIPGKENLVNLAIKHFSLSKIY
ncbi:MAG: uroporphyrinogen-III synthase [Bacteroidota bacterium]|nr:uroporphyrinogen-III synthase [Bacteroidota bacterium]